MAKCVAGAFSAEVRGKVGGLVYNSWRGFCTVKAKHAPAQPRTQKQLAQRALGIMLSRAWADLSNQAAWNQYAQTHTLSDWTNSPKRLTGHNWFVGLNARYYKSMGAIKTTPPAVNAPAAVEGLACTGGAAQISAAWDTPSGPNDRVEFWLDGPHTVGRLGSLPRAQFKAIKEGNAKPCVMTGLAPGTWTVYARVQSIVDGQVSPWISATATVS